MSTQDNNQLSNLRYNQDDDSVIVTADCLGNFHKLIISRIGNNLDIKGISYIDKNIYKDFIENPGPINLTVSLANKNEAIVNISEVTKGRSLILTITDLFPPKRENIKFQSKGEIITFFV